MENVYTSWTISMNYLVKIFFDYGHCPCNVANVHLTWTMSMYYVNVHEITIKFFGYGQSMSMKRTRPKNQFLLKYPWFRTLAQPNFY
jgi:hypothetical protein